MTHTSTWTTTDGETALLECARLLERGAWFQLSPLGNDKWRFTAKPGNEPALCPTCNELHTGRKCTHKPREFNLLQRPEAR